MVTAVLLAAGYATRLYPLTKDRPKALLPLGSGTILDGVIRTLGEVPDLRKTVLVTNHRFADQFHAWQQASGAKVEVIDDGTTSAETRLGAIRDLALALLLLGMGLDEFSTSPVQLPIIKQVIRAVEYTFARSVAEQALKLRTGKEVEAFLQASLKQVAPALVE